MALPLQKRDAAEIVQSLAEQVRQIETARRPAGAGVVSSGSESLDRLLPEGGFRRGSLVEYLAAGGGSGAGSLAFVAAAQAARAGGAIVVVDRQRWFYPPAVVGLGIELARLVVVRPESAEDHAWAIDQVLRSRGVAAAWCWPEDEDDHTLRRWQLAVESSGVLGLLMRGQEARHQPSWAEVRLAIEPVAEPRRQAAGRARRLRVEVVRSRTALAGRVVELEMPVGRGGSWPIDEPAWSNTHETRAVHLAPPLALAKAGRRSRRA
jgi:hypothetical protein